ncbi:N-acetylmuramoyl-L-alanine amidase [Dehalobacterium formicoaceticum]|uniref:N-acetylmuramoyl-L-alanine amidase n=1 Tax=Dehalobacterium formicoaceticum TaxID=51515 RepID=A0ABT1Y5M9_9FIRM|nr:N-acetylmuramoyl-L-alanine amidase [Dehalobacterium formicoaceticum]MCR6546182.1 N-acetylmuramoyl-L-alanine amidase [Dehalobacterium formicoaceticum]
MKLNWFPKKICIILLTFCLATVMLGFNAFAAEKKVNIKVDGVAKQSDVSPYIDGQNRTIVPLRFIGEELGYSFSWNENTKQVVFTGGTNLISLTIGSKDALVNGQRVQMDTVAVARSGRTMVPIRFVLENLGIKVDYNSSSNTVNVVTKDVTGNSSVRTQVALIAEDNVNVRKGPGTEYGVIKKVNKGDSFQILAVKNDWYQIALDSAADGWVAGWLLTLRGSSDLASRSPEPEESRNPVKVEPEKPVNLVHIDDVDVDVENGEVFITVSGDDKLKYTSFALDNPKRLVIDFSDAALGNFGEENEQRFDVSTDRVQGVRLAQFAADKVRIVVDVSGPAGLTLITNKDREKTFQISKPTITGKTVVLDAGHGSIQPGGWSDSGAVGPSNLYERDVVLSITKKVRDILESKGVNVLMTRTGDTRLTLGGRADVANKNGADIFVSIHANANTKSSINGTSTYYYAGVAGQAEVRKKLAQSVQQSLVDAAQRKNIGVLQASFAVLKYTDVPSILVETAFISNPTEEKLLADDDFRQTLAEGIAQGIENFFLNQ